MNEPTTQRPSPERKKKRRGLFRFGRKKKQSSSTDSQSLQYDHNLYSSFQGDAMSAPPTTVWHETVQSSPPPNGTRAAVVVTAPKPPTTTSPRISNVAQQAERGWLFRSKRFQRMCDNVFDAIDTDGSGSIDEKELYAGLLLIHLKLGAYAGPAACRPLGRDRCHAVFVDMDTDNSGQLDRDEFRQVMIFLFGNVLIRVLVQWSMTLLIVPLVAQLILDGVYWITDTVYTIVTTLDDYYWIANQCELALEAAWAMVMAQLPAVVVSTASTIGQYLEMVPESVWNSIPLTLLSTILGIAVVPYIIFSIDEFFHMAAKSHVGKDVKKD